jgi:23S rRNA G2445 N2-methylase RlmL
LCVDIDARRITEASANARAAGVAERITFLNQDLFATDLRGVTVVMLFLSPDFNLRLRPKLERELGVGARVVSHWHDMGDWRPSRTLRMRSDGRERAVYLWILDGRR